MIWTLLCILLGICVPSSGSYSTHLSDYVATRTGRPCNYVTKVSADFSNFPKSVVLKPP